MFNDIKNSEEFKKLKEQKNLYFSKFGPFGEELIKHKKDIEIDKIDFKLI